MPDVPRLAVLRYRKIGPLTEEDWLTSSAVPEEVLDEQLAALRRLRWEAVDAAALARGLRHPDDLPERSVLATFDGGYRATLERALPVLRKYRVPAVVFVATERVGTTTSFEPDSDLPEAVAGWEELRELESDEVVVASMGTSGAGLSGLPPAALEREVADSWKTLARRVTDPAPLFAYPRGDPGPDPAATGKVLRLAGYAAAFGTGGGTVALPPAAPWRLARITMTQGTDLSTELRP